MGFNIPFYIIFGTNLLTGGPAQIVVFLRISVFRRKGISNGIQTERNLREDLFWNKRNEGDLEWTSSNQQGGHEAGRRACPLGAPPPLWAPRSSTDLLLSPIYILLYPENIQGSHETTFPPPQPSVPVRFHLGPFPAICRRGIRSRRASTSTP